MSNRCRTLESDQCRQVLPIVGSWHVNLVLICFGVGQVPQRCLLSKLMSSIKMFWPFTTSAGTTRASHFWFSRSSWNINSEQRRTSLIIIDKMFWPCTYKVHALSGSNFFPLTEKASHLPVCFSMKTTSWAGAIPARLICVLRACTRVIYSRAGFDQRLLAWLTREPTVLHASTPFAQIGQGYLTRDLCVRILLHLR